MWTEAIFDPELRVRDAAPGGPLEVCSEDAPEPGLAALDGNGDQMLKALNMQRVGPVARLSASFADRLNVLTGDNGLGKSFLLDVVFWALTGTWPGGRVAIPERVGRKDKPTITYQVAGKTGPVREPKIAIYDPHSQSWKRPAGRPLMPGLVVYAAVDGDFAVWDPARNYWRETATGQVVPSEQPRAYQFTRQSIEKGLYEDGRVLCNGIVDDWKTWYYQQVIQTPSLFALLAQVIDRLAHPDEPMRAGKPQRVFVDDTREFPTLDMPYGSVPYPHFSAGVARVVRLAYLLVWAWYEHTQAAALRGEEPTDRFILLIDEVEAHLHPKWQRVILPALIQVVEGLSGSLRVQAITATHSPMVLASLEPWFDEDTDRLFWFDLKDAAVHFQLYPWAKHGDVTGWLESDIFGLKRARSREAETAMDAAEAFMAGEVNRLPPALRTREAIQKEMHRVLPGDDPLWSRWLLKTGGRKAQ
jgi:hypothetical protein